MREAVEQTEGWDDPVPEELRSKWIKNEKGSQEILKFYKPGFIKDISIEKAGVVRKCTVQHQNSSENLPQFTDRARSLLKLFIIDNVGWQQDIDLVDKLIEEVDDVKKDVVQKFAKNFMSGLQYRLRAVSDYYDCLEQEIGVQHRPKTKFGKLKFTEPFISCCCSSHCVLTDNGKLTFLSMLIFIVIKGSCSLACWIGLGWTSSCPCSVL